MLPDGPAARVRLTVAGGRFGEVTADVDPRPGDERLSGVVLPGLANAHSHAFHRALRGRTHGAPAGAGTSSRRRGTFWTWREQMYRLAARLDPDRYFDLTRLVFTEMVLAGYTAVGEFHYLHHDHRGRRYSDPNAMGRAVLAAADAAGIRITLLDTCYLSGGLDRTGHRELDPVQRRFSDGGVAAWRDRVGALTGAGTRGTVPALIGTAGHSVRAVPAEQLGAVAAAFPDRPLHVHLSEQPAENEATLAHYGCTPTELLDRHQVLGPRTTVVHATPLTADDVDRIGRSRTTACFCPTTERDLADGIGPARELADAGAPPALGSDQHAVVDPFEELRGLEAHERLRTGERGRFTPEELITAASWSGYRSLGWPNGGRLEAGAPADLVLVASDTVRTAGSRPDQIGYAATAADVRLVVVDGDRVVTEGRHRAGEPDLTILDRLWEES